jgi:hypothetical protein
LPCRRDPTPSPGARGTPGREMALDDEARHWPDDLPAYLPLSGARSGRSRNDRTKASPAPRRGGASSARSVHLHSGSPAGCRGRPARSPGCAQSSRLRGSTMGWWRAETPPNPPARRTRRIRLACGPRPPGIRLPRRGVTATPGLQARRARAGCSPPPIQHAAPGPLPGQPSPGCRRYRSRRSPPAGRRAAGHGASPPARQPDPGFTGGPIGTARCHIWHREAAGASRRPQPNRLDSHRQAPPSGRPQASRD